MQSTTRQVLAVAAVRQLLAQDGLARSIRQSNGLSLADVAGALPGHASPTTVWRWERGERVPRGELAVAYGRILAELAGADPE